MRHPFPFLCWLGPTALALLLVAPGQLRAQACLLAPVPLATRVQQAPLVVEARVSAQQVERLPDGHLATRSTLQVFKVFKGQPARTLRVLTLGGTLGLAREAVSGTLALQVGAQGVFLLEADPDYPASLRPYAGPQGFIAYDLDALTAADPFARYPTLGADLYPALAALAGQPYQAVQPNADLAAAQARAARPAAQRLAATPAVSSFSPTAATAGTSTTTTTSANGVLTINGSGFNATQGTGYVTFRSADNPNTTTRPLASDYLAWSDTQLQVRVPSASASGNTVGTGPVQVVNSDGNATTLGSDLTVTYALSNVTYAASSTSQTYAAQLVGTGETGNASGYVLRYAASLPPAAQPPFEAALTTWRCQAGANRTIGAPTSNDVTSQNGENVVRFGSLASGVLGVTYSYYTGCYVGSTLSWELAETDYVFSSTATWNYATAAPNSSQYDFQSVALHELGHGIQLAHIISSTGVMNYAIANGATRRTLDGDTDLAAASTETAYSTSATQFCNSAYVAYAASTAGCALPVQLVAFAGRYAPGAGTALRWTTASEQQSAYFAVESQEAGASTWQEVLRQPAAGSSAGPRQYQALDGRPLAGTRYYRLRQADLDGTLAYSPTVAVRGQADALAAYPNPATGLVHLSGPLAPAATARVHLLDALGRAVRQATGPAGQADFDLPLAGLPAGLYVLVWDGDAAVSRLRLVVE